MSDGPIELPDIHDKSHQISYVSLASDTHPTTISPDQHRTQTTDELHGGEEDTPGANPLHTHIIVFSALLAESLRLLLLSPKSLDYPDAGEIVLELGIDIPQSVADGPINSANPTAEPIKGKQHERHRDHGSHPKFPGENGNHNDHYGDQK